MYWAYWTCCSHKQ